MSKFGKYGTGGEVPGKYPMAADDNNGNFTFKDAVDGTDDGQPDSYPEVTAESFGAPEHNKAK